MSTLNVANITDGTTTVGTSYVVNGSAKAWVNFNGTGTIAARDSFNVASLTDNGTGDYTVNFTTAISDANYTISGCGQTDTAGDPRNGIFGPYRSATSFLTSSCRVGYATFGGGTISATNAVAVSVTIHR